MSRPRVVIAGLGDSGLLTAIHLARRAEVIGISSKPGLVSGQELGLRLARPETWARDYRVGFDRFRALRHVAIVHGLLIGLDRTERTVLVRLPDGGQRVVPYDVLVISTGVTNGFWRLPDLESDDEVARRIRNDHDTLARAASVLVVGGGAAAVSSAANVAARWPDKVVDLYYPGDRGLPHHHPGVWRQLSRRLTGLGIGLHPGHRAELPGGAATDRLTSGSVTWSTGQHPVAAEAVIWAVGQLRPNTGWLPPELLDAAGFVRVRADLRLPDLDDVFAVGDVAATDPLRTSARNSGHRLLAHNIRAKLAGRALRDFRPARRRWGSVIGVQQDGLEIFAPNGRPFRIPVWAVDAIVQPLIVRGAIYRGVRNRSR